VEKLTWSQVRFGGEQPKEHHLVTLLDSLHVWYRKHRECFGGQFQKLDSEGWYTATRYPEDMSGTSWIPEPR